MNSLLWVAQISLAAVFLYSGVSKVVVYERKTRALRIRAAVGNIGFAAALGLLEIVAALAIVVPADLWPPSILPRIAAAVLAVLALVAARYHARREGPAAPVMALFVTALFVIIGRWP
jgi:uncharacterized membrane protein YphA (DoxX/SURF4 family)